MTMTRISTTGQITIPENVRRQLGLTAGCRVELAVVENHLELRAVASGAAAPASGFGLVRSPRPTVPADFDPALLLRPDDAP